MAGYAKFLREAIILFALINLIICHLFETIAQKNPAPKGTGHI